MYENLNDEQWKVKIFNRALKAFNKMLQDKRIEKIVKHHYDKYDIHYKDGTVFTCSGPLCEAANIFYQEEV